MYRTDFKIVSLIKKKKKFKGIGIGFADNFQFWQNHVSAEI